MYKYITAILLLVGVYYFCESQTKGFRLQEIFSDIPNDPSWETAGPPIELKLQQTFKYLGSGEQCHAFLGEDQKTVLKFFRHSAKHDPRPAFDSCKLAYEELREHTGIQYVHINKTQHQFNKVNLLDPIGIAHEVDLDATEFLVQDYCELVVSRIDAQMEKGDVEGARVSIKRVFQAVEEFGKKGIHIDVPAIRRNIGFSGDKVILLDTGSLTKDDKSEEEVKSQVKHVTHSLGRWVRKHHPSLTPYFEKESAFFGPRS